MFRLPHLVVLSFALLIVTDYAFKGFPLLTEDKECIIMTLSRSNTFANIRKQPQNSPYVRCTYLQ